MSDTPDLCRLMLTSGATRWSCVALACAVVVVGGCCRSAPTFSVLPQGTWSTPPNLESCALDSVNDDRSGNVIAHAGKPAVIVGWLLAADGRPPGDFQLALGSATAFATPGQTGIGRRDVAQRLDNPAAAQAGFKLALPALDVPPDSYAIRVIAAGADGQPSVCDTHARITVVP